MFSFDATFQQGQITAVFILAHLIISKFRTVLEYIINKKIEINMLRLRGPFLKISTNEWRAYIIFINHRGIFCLFINQTYLWTPFMSSFC